MSGETAGWGSVAADGTDPDRLERVVAAVARSRGTRAIVRRAVEVALSADAAGPASVLDSAIGAATRTEREAIGAVARRWVRLGVRVATVGDPAYPRRLLAGWPERGAPPLLAWRGPPAGVADGAVVAIVGARRATAYGTGVAAWLAESVGDAGATVVSGGALGIDAAAHRAALGTPGGTTVVLGCGHDVAYPREHAAPGGLFDRVLDDGGALLSEYLPGVEPKPHNVVARNRIVAGLADAVVVIEGSARSGALRTAAAAADLDVPVLAVPGDVRAPGSAAPHRLLSEGAAPCTSPADLLQVLGGAVGGGAHGEPATPGPSPLPAPVLDELARRWPRAVTVDELAVTAGVPAGRLLASLTRARVAGLIVESAEGVRLRRLDPG